MSRGVLTIDCDGFMDKSAFLTNFLRCASNTVNFFEIKYGLVNGNFARNIDRHETKSGKIKLNHYRSVKFSS